MQFSCYWSWISSCNIVKVAVDLQTTLTMSTVMKFIVNNRTDTKHWGQFVFFNIRNCQTVCSCLLDRCIDLSYTLYIFPRNHAKVQFITNILYNLLFWTFILIRNFMAAISISCSKCWVRIWENKCHFLKNVTQFEIIINNNLVLQFA